MGIIRALCEAADDARLHGRKLPVITTDIATARILARAIEAEVGGRFSGALPHGVVAMFDGVQIRTEEAAKVSAAAAPTFEVGKSYRTRDGHLTGPLSAGGNASYPLKAKVGGDCNWLSWTNEGKWHLLKENHALDLLPDTVKVEAPRCLRCGLTEWRHCEHCASRISTNWAGA